MTTHSFQLRLIAQRPLAFPSAAISLIVTLKRNTAQSYWTLHSGASCVLMVHKLLRGRMNWPLLNPATDGFSVITYSYSKSKSLSQHPFTLLSIDWSGYCIYF
ncbi:hypothetical protein EDC52_103280 [Biostraticola tofi]|uniref:Uncharacterized protein n=1 Tax=Biostraticola tofi TaxID=466109 RepID=A0A4R3Z2Y2_9GAMM|nr:hypothetical protein EDC52_103280 [Biostraticola tofi]